MAKKITKRQRKSKCVNSFVLRARKFGKTVRIGGTEYVTFHSHRNAGMTLVLA